MKGRAAFVIVGALALGACAAPSSFEGLIGGIKQDDSIGAPRPMSPVSVSMVATYRPRLKWQLAGALTGAIVEMSKAKDFPAEGTKSFVASGSELVVPEDLEPGIWFWRLAGTTPGARGTNKSAVWEVLVRGPARFGSSEAPNGSVVDIDADGVPDLLTVGDELEDAYYTMPYEFRGKLTGELELAETPMIIPIAYADRGQAMRPVSVTAGVDFDGDGFSDFAFVTQDNWRAEDPVLTVGATVPGSAKGLDYDRMADLALAFTGIEATLHAAGDVDGDGYGDAIIGGDTVAFVSKGSATGANALAPVFPIRDYPPVKKGRAVLGAFDADGDGTSDIAVAQPKLDLDAWRNGSGVGLNAILPAPVRVGSSTFSAELGGESTDSPPGPDFRKAVLLSSGVSHTAATTHVLSVSQAPTDGATAKSMATGDFNGDGLADVAMVMIDRTSAKVCIYVGSRERYLVDIGCIDGIPDALGIDAITTGDLEGDGQDELLVAGGGKVRSVHFDQGVAPRVDIVADVGRVTAMTTVWPGRPGLTRWAVSAGNVISVFKGTAVEQRLGKPQWVTRGFARTMR